MVHGLVGFENDLVRLSSSLLHLDAPCSAFLSVISTLRSDPRSPAAPPDYSSRLQEPLDSPVLLHARWTPTVRPRARRPWFHHFLRRGKSFSLPPTSALMRTMHTNLNLQVAAIRDEIRSLDSSISALSDQFSHSLSSNSPELIDRIKSGTERTQSEARGLKNRISVLGTKVGRDEAKRGHWDTLKGSLGRAVQKLQSSEMAHRERVRERVVRQYKIGE